MCKKRLFATLNRCFKQWHSSLNEVKMPKRTARKHKSLETKTFSNLEKYAEFEAFNLQQDLTDKLKKARQHAHFTQENVAEKMNTQKTSIARLEAAGGKSKHMPSLLTLVKYAHVLGYRLEVKLVQKSRAVD